MASITSQPDTGFGPSHTHPAKEVLQLLGSARMFSLAVEQLAETPVQQEIAGERLSRSQWKLLEIFALTDVQNVTDIASYQGVSTAAASKAADRLVRLGLLTRNEDLEDRRHIRLALSAEGVRLVNRYLTVLQDRVARVFDALPRGSAPHLAMKLDELIAMSKATEEEMRRICLQCGLNRREPCLLRESRGSDCNFNAHHRSGQRDREASATEGLRPVSA